MSDNISRSGLLFRPAETLDVDSPVEIMLALTALTGDATAATAICRGRIVRTLPAGAGAPAAAATIVGYKLVRPTQSTTPRSGC